MIGQLRGILVAKHPPYVLLDVAGVGYEVAVSMNTFYQLPELNQTMRLCTHLVVREDAQLLYGFHDDKERRLFRSLIRVNGVGPKLALTILSGIDADGFVRCVLEHDAASLVRLPGVGKKTAERLIIEMKDRLSDTGNIDIGIGTQPVSAKQDAISALLALGYKQGDAVKAISKLYNDNASLTSEELIKMALQEMMS